ncbi:hypothetical protein BDV95DRAFT_593246 [Massariosphaeria phaeospora]|uniref:Uncharacterized protein n=1 Tax=Massariosphaeria phaeospora TaxID=100035 RepID=A0A7C8MAE3_9PLEO|nr:hypothetical protein BDV95DRAFT_593246 [Massariosphaeria phaeospora]
MTTSIKASLVPVPGETVKGVRSEGAVDLKKPNNGTEAGNSKDANVTAEKPHQDTEMGKAKKDAVALGPKNEAAVRERIKLEFDHLQVATAYHEYLKSHANTLPDGSSPYEIEGRAVLLTLPPTISDAMENGKNVTLSFTDDSKAAAWKNSMVIWKDVGDDKKKLEIKREWNRPDLLNMLRGSEKHKHDVQQPAMSKKKAKKKMKNNGAGAGAGGGENVTSEKKSAGSILKGFMGLKS